MLILHIIVDLTPGGAELMLKRLVAFHRGSPDYRHHVISLRSKATVGPQIEALGVAVETMGLHGLLSFPAAFVRLVRRVRALRPQVVQCWMYHGDLLGGLAARAAGVRNILWGVRATHIGSGAGTSRLTALIRRICARLSRRIPARIVYVANAARAAHEALGYDPSRSVVIPNGYDIPAEAADDAGRLRVRRSLGLDPDSLLVGTAGRFNALKDYGTFVAAAALVAERRPDAHFLMMGRGLDAANAELGRWVEESGQAGRFHLLGEQPDLDPWLAGLDIFCLHSISEGFPNVVAEAMALGVPCVVTDVGDAAHLVGDTGLVTAPGDPPALASALAGLLGKEREARRRLGARARSRIIENFSMEAAATAYERLWNASSSLPAAPSLE